MSTEHDIEPRGDEKGVKVADDGLPRGAVVVLSDGDARLWVLEDFLRPAELAAVDLDALHDRLEANPRVMIRGKEGRQHRDVGFFSDESGGYRYSGSVVEPQPTTPGLASLMARVNALLGTGFNGVLVNRYKDGRDYIGAHSDDERGLDPKNRAVASVSCGPATRRFRVRSRETGRVRLDLDHPPGALLVMEGSFQSRYTHEIPAQAKVLGGRTSLTFRRHSK